MPQGSVEAAQPPLRDLTPGTADHHDIVADDDGAIPKRHGSWRTSRTAVTVLLLGAGFVVLVALLYLSSVHAAAGNSDGATVILEGKAMSGGNLTLNHWALSLDSFWLVDVLAYAVAVLLGGVHPQLLHLVPAVVAAAVIALGAWIAARGRSGLAAFAAAGTVVVLLGLPTHAFAEFFLMGPLHVTTMLWCLIAFVALRRARLGIGWAVAVVFLAAGMLGDLQTAALGVAPVGLAGLVTMLRGRSWRRGAPAVSAALASVALAELIRRIARAAGTFAIAPANPRASFHQMTQNIHHVVTYGAALEGVGYHPFGSQSVPPVLGAAHAIGLALGLAALVSGLVSIVWSSVSGEEPPSSPERREAAWFNDTLVFAFFGGCAVYVWLSFSASGAFGRYLTSAVIAGSILAGRLLGAAADRSRRAAHSGSRPWFAWPAAVAALLVLAGYATTFASTLDRRPPVQPAVALTRYLQGRHLTRGIGDYWSTSIVTVESSGGVVARPVIAVPGGRLARYLRQTSASWYGHGFQFLVYNTAAPWGSVGAKTAIVSFGQPSHVASVGTYRVLTWPHDLSVPGSGR